MFEKPKNILKAYVKKNNIKCCYCGRTFTHRFPMSIDHLISKMNGGGYGIDNIVVSCIKCNSVFKKNMNIDKFLLKFPQFKKCFRVYMKKLAKLEIRGILYIDAIKWVKKYLK